jgi:hypothetical protein
MTPAWHLLPPGFSYHAALRPAAVRAVPEQMFFVIPFADYELTEHLPPALPLPVAIHWINRGTGQCLRSSSIAMLLRTRGRTERLMPSVVRLHQWSGLRLIFATAEDRNRFARAWRDLCAGNIAAAA